MVSKNIPIHNLPYPPNKILCVSHSQDLDGIASAAMVVHYLKIPLGNVSFSDHAIEAMRSTLNMVKHSSIHDGIIVFSDLPLNDSFTSVVDKIIKTLQKRNNKVIWMDHHMLTLNAEATIAKTDMYEAGENKRFCGAELIYKNLVKEKERYGNKLAKIAHDSDFYVTDSKYLDIILRFGSAITYVNYTPKTAERDLRKLVKILSDANYNDKFLVGLEKKYIKEAEVNKIKTRKTVTTHRIGNLTLGIGSGLHIDDNSACRGIIMDEFGSDIAVFINTAQGKLKIRSKEGIDCSLLVRSLGGGGHPQAAGASPKNVKLGTAKGLEKIRKMILENAARIYPK